MKISPPLVATAAESLELVSMSTCVAGTSLLTIVRGNVRIPDAVGEKTTSKAQKFPKLGLMVLLATQGSRT